MYVHVERGREREIVFSMHSLITRVAAYAAAGREGLSSELCNMGRYRAISFMVFLYRFMLWYIYIDVHG